MKHNSKWTWCIFPSVIKGTIGNTGIEFLLLSTSKIEFAHHCNCMLADTSLFWHIIYISNIFQIYLNNISLISPTAVFWSESWRIVWPGINSLVRTPLPWPTETWAPHCNVILYLYTLVMCKLHCDVMSLDCNLSGTLPCNNILLFFLVMCNYIVTWPAHCNIDFFVYKNISERRKLHYY